MSIVDRVKVLANGKSLTLAELERKLNFSNSSIRRWNERTPGIDKVQKVADYFDVSTDYLLGRTDLPKETDNSQMAKQVMMRMDTEGLSSSEIDEIEQEMERFFSWRIEEIKRERGEK